MELVQETPYRFRIPVDLGEVQRDLSDSGLNNS